MNKFSPSEYSIENAIQEISRYDGIFVGDNYVIKDHGDYLEINIDADNDKGHISYNLRFNEDGSFSWEKHR